MTPTRKMFSLALSGLILVGAQGCTQGCSTSKKAADSNSSATQSETAEPTSSGAQMDLKIEDLKAGEGKEAVAGKMVSVHYTGWLTDGTEFDSSLKRGPFKFKLGAHQVIPGWDQGVQGMKIGGKRKLTIPPELAYGAQGAGSVIPPNATLVFEVELLDVLE